MEEELKNAYSLAGKVKKEVKKWVGKTEGRTSKQGYGDETYRIDEIAEKVVEEFCGKKGITYITEDKGRCELNSPYLYLIDPIDGTRNAMRDLPNYCCSIAIAENKQGKEKLADLKMGLVLEMDKERRFHAIKNEGSFENGKRFISPERDEEKIALGLGSDFGDAYAMHSPFIEKISKTYECQLKIYNSSALSLCYVASGRLNAFVDLRALHDAKIIGGMHDIAAGVVILSEAKANFEILSKHQIYLDPKCKVSIISACSSSLFKNIKNST